MAAIIENGTAGTVVNGSGRPPRSPTPASSRLGADRLALQFVGVDDDNPLGPFTGMSGGTWAEAVAEFASATGTDGAIQLQTATIASAGTIDGGSFTMAAADNWGVIGFALMPLYLKQEGYRFRNDDGNETAATWRQALNTSDTIALDTPFRIRFAIANLGGGITDNYQGQFRRKPSGGAFGAWTNIAPGTALRIGRLSPRYTSTSLCTQQISSGPFTGGWILENNAQSAPDHPGGTVYEVEFLFDVRTANGAAAGDEYELRIVQITGPVILASYAQTPVAHGWGCRPDRHLNAQSRLPRPA